jgi:Family of unknown function (DUF6529)
VLVASLRQRKPWTPDPGTSRLPGWALPVLGGLVFTLVVGLWLSSALWFFRNVGFPNF